MLSNVEAQTPAANDEYSKYVLHACVDFIPNESVGFLQTSKGI